MQFEERCDVDKELRRQAAMREQASQKAADEASHPGLTRGHRALGKNLRMPEALP